MNAIKRLQIEITKVDLTIRSQHKYNHLTAPLT